MSRQLKGTQGEMICAQPSDGTQQASSGTSATTTRQSQRPIMNQNGQMEKFCRNGDIFCHSITDRIRSTTVDMGANRSLTQQHQNGSDSRNAGG
jgi:hypothetical protein